MISSSNLLFVNWIGASFEISIYSPKSENSSKSSFIFVYVSVLTAGLIGLSSTFLASGF